MTLSEGTYYFRVEAWEAGANAYKIRYGVETAEVGVGANEPDLPGWHVAGSAMVVSTGKTLARAQIDSVTPTLSGPETHVINHAGDVDWFRVNLEADSQYAIKVIGRDIHNNTGFTLSGSEISGVFNSDAHHYPYTHDVGGAGNGKSMLLFHSQHRGSEQTYFVSVSAGGINTGTYRIIVAKMEEPEDWTFGHVMGARGSVTVDGGAEDGRIDFKGDIDLLGVRGHCRRVATASR